jgi:hypothetical protein
MELPFEGLQEKSSLFSPHLIVSLSKLMHLLLMPDSAQHIVSYTEGFEFKNIGNRYTNYHTSVDSVITLT